MFVGKRSRNVKLSNEWDIPTDDDILKGAEQALERPSNAAFWDDDVYETHTLMFYSAPDSDDLIAQSNFRSILEDIQSVYPHAIERASIRHWTYSRFDCVKVRVTYANGEIHPAFIDALTIATRLRDSYPLYDEDDYSSLELEEWDRAISDAIEYALTDLSDTEDPDTFRQYMGEYLTSESAQLIGYHDVGYVPDETVSDAIEYARGEIARLESLGMVASNNSGEYIEW